MEYVKRVDCLEEEGREERDSNIFRGSSEMTEIRSPFEVKREVMSVNVEGEEEVNVIH